jgi:hypothetical protein
MQTGIVSASVPSKSKITPLMPIAPSLASVSVAPNPQRCRYPPKEYDKNDTVSA